MSLGEVSANVRVLERPLAVRVSCVVVDAVEPSPALLLRLEELDARLTLARLVLVNGAVFLSIDVPAAPFRIEHLRVALAAARRLGGDLRLRLRDVGPAASA